MKIHSMARNFNRSVLPVFVVAPRRIGGVEMFSRELSLQLADHGWNSVLCFASEPPEFVRNFLEAPNVAIETAPLARTIWKAIQSFSEILARHRPEILHMSFTDQVSPYAWLGRMCGVRRSYMTDHLSRREGFVPTRSARWKRAVSLVVNFPLTNLIAVSDYNARASRTANLIPKERIVRLYNGVDLTRNVADGREFRRKYQIPAERLVVLQVSWMIYEKGFDDLLAAARIVLSKHTNVQFVLAGDGAHREQFIAQVEEVGMANHFTWPGLIDDPLNSGVYAAADVVCQLSRQEEAFGWTNTEAMRFRKPLIATRVGGIPEIIEDGVSGFLVERRQPEQVAAKILELLADARRRESMGARGLQIVEEKFSMRKNVAELLRLYGIPDSPCPVPLSGDIQASVTAPLGP